MIDITFPDGSVRQYNEGVSGYEIAKSLSEGLAREVLAVEVKAADDDSAGDGEVVDLTRPITADSSVKFLKWEDEGAKRVFWHTSSHLMAEALQFFYPGIKFGIGPAVDNGFYYDVDPGEGVQITDADLPKIEKKMLELARTGETLKRTSVSKADAMEYFSSKGDQYKCELISELPDGCITFYENGTFTDLCRGPHLMSTAPIKAVKLTSIAGAYWRGDQNRDQLTRIYGITFPKKSMLDEYLVLLEEAKKRDHRKLGKEMKLFTFSSKVGLGLPLWLPRGAAMRYQLESFLRKKLTEQGYLQVVSPHIGSKQLYVTSGHWAKYGKDSFQPIKTPQEGEEYMLKPMNCPHHCEIFASEPRSYKDLPIRLAEFGTVYRYEQSGELHGLTRVRSFTQDDAHMYVRPDQLKDEFKKVIDLIQYVFDVFKFDKFTAQISLRDKKDRSKYIGSEENWEKAERAIIESAAEKGLPAVVKYGEAAFYGPKLDFMVKDALGREWQLGTIQVDYNLPERFQLEYTDTDGSKKRPVMIHRATFGSIERFTAVLLEHTAGHLPLWLSPDQVKVLPVSEKYAEYAEKVCELLKNSEIRASIDDRNETLGKRIREIALLRVPVLLIIGEKEAADGTVSIRYEGADAGVVKKEDFLKWFKSKIDEELHLQG